LRNDALTHDNAHAHSRTLIRSTVSAVRSCTSRTTR